MEKKMAIDMAIGGVYVRAYRDNYTFVFLGCLYEYEIGTFADPQLLRAMLILINPR